MKIIRQIIAVTAMNLRALPLRVTPALVSVIGIAGVVLILVALLSISEGFRRTLELSGSDRVAVVLRGSSSAELTSSFSQEQVQIIEQAPGIARDSHGPIISAELYTTVDQPKRTTGTAANAPFRGVEPCRAPDAFAFQADRGAHIRDWTIRGHCRPQRRPDAYRPGSGTLGEMG